jgi:GrpB-like predicted nucleotidyltransferase (UPF0157 family)
MRERVFFGAVADHRAKADAGYARVREQILRLAPAAIIEHVGSTSLPDGLTKGDLDVQVRMRAEDFDDACRALASIYADNPGGFTDRGRSFKDDSSDPPLGVHVTIIGGPSDIQSKQRDLLRRRPALRAAYDELKRGFDGGDMDAYREAKDVFFTRLAADAVTSRRWRMVAGFVALVAAVGVFWVVWSARSAFIEVTTPSVHVGNLTAAPQRLQVECDGIKSEPIRVQPKGDVGQELAYSKGCHLVLLGKQGEPTYRGANCDHQHLTSYFWLDTVDPPHAGCIDGD